jgi:hypothetical protein
MGLVNVVSIPVVSATTVPPTSGWAGFGRSVRGELRAWRTLFEKVVVHGTGNSPSLLLLIRVCEEEDFQIPLEAETK